MTEKDDDGPSAFRLIGGIVVIGIVFSVTFGGLGMYMDTMEEGWGQHACEEKYGESAEYVGETSAFGGSGICDVNGEQKYVEVKYEGLLPPSDSGG